MNDLYVYVAKRVFEQTWQNEVCGFRTMPTEPHVGEVTKYHVQAGRRVSKRPCLYISYGLS